MNKTRVRVTEQLFGSDTEQKFKVEEQYMAKMAGKVYEVNLSPETLRKQNNIRIECPENGRDFIFSMKDITILYEDDDLNPMPVPETFDPKHLDI